MIKTTFRNILERWRERRLARAGGVLEDLKIRYHTFRVLLANNERALDLLRSVQRAMETDDHSRADLGDEVEELLAVTYELADGLNLMTGDRHASLYDRHGKLASAVREALDEVMTTAPRGPRAVFLGQLSKGIEEICGGKASNLAMLRRAGFPVPDGFVVTSRACGELLAANGLDTFIRRRMQRFEGGRFTDSEVETAAAEIRLRILDAVPPDEFREELAEAHARLTDSGRVPIAVRSSALVEDRVEHSFAGQFKSVLNVTSHRDFEAALKEVLASNYNARSTIYRIHSGLPLARHDMAVLCIEMVPARAAGGLLTVDPAAPAEGRMLLSAVSGLGTGAVGGSAPADLHRPLRDGSDLDRPGEWSRIAVKSRRTLSLPGGGIGEEEMDVAAREAPLLSSNEIRELVRCGRGIETLVGAPQDIEWALSEDGRIYIVQSRSMRLPMVERRAVEAIRGETILRGGVCASPGRCVGRVKIAHSPADIEDAGNEAGENRILVLHQSLVEAARWLPRFRGVVVDLGNPADHLSCVAREYDLPMLTGITWATRMLDDGQWVVLDADRAEILKAPEDIRAYADGNRAPGREPVHEPRPRKAPVSPALSRLTELVSPLNLTDAYGPTFSIRECRTLHDIVRYTHEMAVLAMFDAGDLVLEEADVLVRHIEGGGHFKFLIVDLGGGVAPGVTSRTIRPEDLLSIPLGALWRGMSTPGLRWNKPPPGASLSGLFTRSLLDGRGTRPVGNQNYALITRDYLNLNARVDYHFAMIDTICGLDRRENHIRFRFKGGGTAPNQRERRARFVARVLEANDFTADRRGDLVTASLLEMDRDATGERLVMLGRLLGFSRLLDAAMTDDDMPARVARAFLDGDYGLDSLDVEPA